MASKDLAGGKRAAKFLASIAVH